MAAFPGPADAHEIVPGVGGFAGLMLHPLLLPEQAFCLFASVLLASRVDSREIVWCIGALAAGMLFGRVVILLLPGLRQIWYLPMVAAILAGMTVATFGALPRTVALTGIFLLAATGAIGILPETGGRGALRDAVVAAVLTNGLALLVLALPLTFATGHWAMLAIRAMGAWLAALALLFLAFAWRIILAAGG